MTTFDPLVFLDNAEDWNQIVNISKTSQSIGESSHIPIEDFALSVATQTKFIVVLILINYSKVTWSYGGEIRQLFVFPAINSQAQHKAFPLRIDVPEIIDLKTITVGNFNLKYFPPPWFRDVTIKVWEYRGEVLNFGADALFNIETKVNSNLSESNSEINERLARIEAYLDQLL